LLRLRHVVIALLRMRHCCVCTYCVCSTPNLRPTHIAFTALSLGGQGFGVQAATSKYINNVNERPPFAFGL